MPAGGVGLSTKCLCSAKEETVHYDDRTYGDCSDSYHGDDNLGQGDRSDDDDIDDGIDNLVENAIRNQFQFLFSYRSNESTIHNS